MRGGWRSEEEIEKRGQIMGGWKGEVRKGGRLKEWRSEGGSLKKGQKNKFLSHVIFQSALFCVYFLCYLAVPDF